MVSMNRGGRSKNAKKEKKEQNPRNSGSSSEEWTTSGGEKTPEGWEKGVEAALKEWAETSTHQGGKLHEFLNLAARQNAKRGKKMFFRYAEGLDVEAVVAEIVWMVEESAMEGEEEKIRKLMEEKDKEGFFGKYGEPHERFDFGGPGILRLGSG